MKKYWSEDEVDVFLKKDIDSAKKPTNVILETCIAVVTLFVMLYVIFAYFYSITHDQAFSALLFTLLCIAIIVGWYLLDRRMITHPSIRFSDNSEGRLIVPGRVKYFL